MTIYTSYFANKKLPEDYAKVRISIGNPRWKLPYVIAGKIPELMPTRDMLNMWKEDYQEKYFRILDGVGIDNIKKATLEELLETESIDNKAANSIFTYFRHIKPSGT